jgi:hypothetical protein
MTAKESHGLQMHEAAKTSSHQGMVSGSARWRMLDRARLTHTTALSTFLSVSVGLKWIEWSAGATAHQRIHTEKC